MKKFVDYLREDGEGAAPVASTGGAVSTGADCGIGTSSADIAPVTMPLGTVLRHVQNDYPVPDDLEDSLEFSLSENGTEVRTPKTLKKKILDVYRERSGYRITEESLTTDNLESVISECLNERFDFECFECYKSIIRFKNSDKTKTFKIYQSVPGIFGN